MRKSVIYCAITVAFGFFAGTADAAILLLGGGYGAYARGADSFSGIPLVEDGGVITSLNGTFGTTAMSCHPTFIDICFGAGGETVLSQTAPSNAHVTTEGFVVGRSEFSDSSPYSGDVFFGSFVRFSLTEAPTVVDITFSTTQSNEYNAAFTDASLEIFSNPLFPTTLHEKIFHNAAGTETFTLTLNPGVYEFRVGLSGGIFGLLAGTSDGASMLFDMQLAQDEITASGSAPAPAGLPLLALGLFALALARKRFT